MFVAFWGTISKLIVEFFLLLRDLFTVPDVGLRRLAALVSERRFGPARLFVAGSAIMLGGILLRINGFLIGYDTGLGVDHGWNYFPSIAEMLVTMGMFALEVLGYIIITRRFPVLPRSAAAH